MAEFKFKPFEEMTPQDYETIGFMSGLEVHQQLLTEKKLIYIKDLDLLLKLLLIKMI